MVRAQQVDVTAHCLYPDEQLNYELDNIRDMVLYMYSTSHKYLTPWQEVLLRANNFTQKHNVPTFLSFSCHRFIASLQLVVWGIGEQQPVVTFSASWHIIEQQCHVIINFVC